MTVRLSALLVGSTLLYRHIFWYSFLLDPVRSKARTVFARSNTAIVGSNPTEAWMFVCVLCAFILYLHSLR
jgi:hypothetical protein